LSANNSLEEYSTEVGAKGLGLGVNFHTYVERKIIKMKYSFKMYH